MAENPCIICEEYIKGRLCDKRNVCPVGIMKRKYLETKRELKEISKKQTSYKAMQTGIGKFATQVRGVIFGKED